MQRRGGNGAVNALLARVPAATAAAPADRLRELFRADDEEGAIAFLASLSAQEAGAVLADVGLRTLAVKCFDDEQMGRAMAGLRTGVRLVQRLNWMATEGSNLGLVWPLLTDPDVPAAERLEVYGRPYLRDFFVKLCGDDEMASVVRVLGGTLEQKLSWMLVEGTSWPVVRRLIADPLVEPREKRALFASKDIRNRLVKLLSHAQLLEAVRLLGGSLAQRLNWLYVEDTNWRTVRSLISDSAVPAAEKVALYREPWAVKLFVEVCDDEQMAEAVRLLGGTTEQQLRWMVAEDTNARLVLALPRAAPRTALMPAGVPADIADGLRDDLNARDYQLAIQVLVHGSVGGVMDAVTRSQWQLAAMALNELSDADLATVVENELPALSLVSIRDAARSPRGRWTDRVVHALNRIIVANEMGRMANPAGPQRAVWSPSGPLPSLTDFSRWAMASSEGPFTLTPSTVINCWEVVIYSAFRTRAVSWSWIHDLYTYKGSDWNEELVRRLSRGAARTWNRVTRLPALRRGDIVFFDGASHVALATGVGTHVDSFWPPPDTAFVAGGTPDRVKDVTIESLLPACDALAHAETPPRPECIVTIATPSW